jgi:hypothetical protein
LDCDLGHPTEFLFGFAGLAEQSVDFGGLVKAGVYGNQEFFITVGNFDNALAFQVQLHAKRFRCTVYEFSNTVFHSGRDERVFGLVLLQQHPLHARVVFGMATVPQGIYVANLQTVFKHLADVGKASRILRVTKVNPAANFRG